MANRLFGSLVVGLSLGFAACGGESITIPPTTGTLQITTSTVGSEPDPDGYTLQVDAQQPQAIGSTATVSVGELAPGTHNVVLTGLAANCTLAGDNPRSVTIAVGETTTAAFELTCGGTTGALDITTQTSGAVPDADGYAISFDGTDRGPIGANAVVTLSNLPPGSHVVGLTGVAANCQVQGDNLRVVTITAGATVASTFAVTCVQPPPTVGTLRITTTTSGPDPDADGYQFAVDGGPGQPIGVNASTDLVNTAAGLHSVVLSNVAANCTVDDASKSTTVLPGLTATVAFSVTCAAVGPTVGSIRVTTTTTGPNPDADGYQFAIDGGSSQPIGANGDQTVGNIAAGSHTVVLSGVAANCTVDDASKSVTVTPGQTSTVSFSVTCTSTGPSASRSDVDADPESFIAGGSTTITVTVRNADGDELSGVPVSLSSTGSGNSFDQASANTNGDGVATFTFSSTVAETKVVTATAGGVVINDQATVRVDLAPSQTVINTDDPDPSFAGQEFPVTFTVSSQSGGVPTGTVTVLGPGGAECSGLLDAQGNGSCNITLTQLDEQTLSANYPGDSRFNDSGDTEQHFVDPAPVPTQAPTANDDPSTPGAYTTPGAGQPLTVSSTEGVLTNDTDPNPGTTLTAIGPAGGATANGGTVSLATDGGFTYTPPPGFSGTDTFTYEASDGSLASLPATVTISVQP
jgi:hypothetical protein